LCLQPERIIDASIQYAPSPEAEPKNTAPLTSEMAFILQKYEQLASQGLRVIRLAHKITPISHVEGITREAAEQGFPWIGWYF
jgi:magnesium-transporting ATPase (P-type)